jgi:hypothetical protein
MQSWNSVLLECWDRVIRVFHPGVLISSLDRKEAEYFNACHAALTNYLYPKCLVHHCELHCLTKKSEPRTMAMMKAVVDEALNAHTKWRRRTSEISWASWYQGMSRHLAIY